MKRWITRSLPVLVALVFGLAIGQWVAEPPTDPEAAPEASPDESATSGHDDHQHGAAAPAEASPAEAEQRVVWTCSMDPQVRQDEPGKCPICGMDLVPVMAGGSRVELTHDARALAGIRTARVERRAVFRPLTLIGQVSYDETLVARATAWFGGRIEKLFVDYVGARVDKGDKLFTIYSPELLVAQRELLEAAKHAKRAGKAGSSSLADAAHRAVEGARERLKLWGLQSWQIARIEKSGTARRTVTVYAPIKGTVTELNAREGDYVKEGTVTFTVADLSRVWVQLEAFEHDLPWLEVGQSLRFETRTLPGELIDGRISFISPTIDARRRTTVVRLEVDDPERRLKPGAFVKARVEATLPGDAPLVIPESAPLLAGDRAVVFVSVEGAEAPAYLLKEVVLGPRAGDVYVVRDGLMEGERVVSSGAFKLDSALQIRGDESLMTPPDEPALATDDEPANPRERLAKQVGEVALERELPAAAARGLDRVIEDAKALSAVLAADDFQRSRAAATALGGSLKALVSGHVQHLPKALAAATEALTGEQGDIASLRDAFGVLNRVLVPLAVATRGQLQARFQTTYCPMAFGDKGAFWLQDDGVVANPYFGAEMLTCGLAVTPPPPPEPRDPSERLAKQVGEVAMERALPAAAARGLDRVIEDAKALSAALAADDFERSRAAATRLRSSLEALSSGHGRHLPAALASAAEGLAVDHGDIVSLRAGFGVVNRALVPLAVAARGQLKARFQTTYCPMAFGDKGAFWLQDEGTVANPYFGAEMLTCGLAVAPPRVGGGQAGHDQGSH